MENLDLFGDMIPEARAHVTFPDAPGFKGNAETSRQAAEAIAPKLGRLQRMTLDAIRGAGIMGLTADELAAQLELDRWSIQRRTSELKAKGMIADSKRRRRNVTGKNAVVWVLPQFSPKNEGMDDER